MNVTHTQELPSGRAKLTRVLRAAGDIVNINDAVTVLGLERTEASKLLSRWTRQGWLKRVGPGRYVSVPLNSLESEHVLEDLWVLVPALFAPAYIGGWSAAEHWDLTEQIFRDIVVMTGQPVRARMKKVHGATFLLRHIAEAKFFGAKTIWRGQTKIDVSDVHRTIIDMLDDPSLGGGIQHVSDCFYEYMKRGDRNAEKLIDYAERIGNGAIFKRMGFLVERIATDQSLIAYCQDHLTKGNAKLDPVLKSPRLITRWRLLVPESWAEAAQ